MTDVLDRRATAPISIGRVPANSSTDSPADDIRPRISLAALSVGAGAIHLAMVPAHMGEWALQGWAFLLTAWVQLGIAFLAVARPSRRLWLGVVLANSAFLSAWIVGRTTGFPFGPRAGVAEDMNIVDVTCVLFELALIVGAFAMVTLPPARRSARGWLFAPVLPIAVLGLTTGVLATPSATDHVHGAAEAHAHEALTPAIAKIQDRGFGTFMNGHAHAIVNMELDPATQEALDAQLAVTRALADEYPTLQDAVADGYRRAGPYVPGLGVHMIKFAGDGYLNPDGVMDDVDLRHPLSLLYLGTESTAELGGFMYYAASAEEPEGFHGRNDGWHYHENLCAVPAKDGFLDFPFGPDFGATKAQCDGVGGNLMDSQWMIHVWTVPGWDDMADYGGVFAEMNPGFACSDGTWFSKPFEEWKDDPLNTCVTGVAAQPTGL